MSERLIFKQEMPETTKREVLASFLTVSGLYPDKNGHILRDADKRIYWARALSRDTHTTGWEIKMLEKRK